MRSIRVTQPAELLAAVPYIIGFHPADSLVLVGLRGTRLHFAIRADLEECQADTASAAQHLATVLARQRIDGAVVIGYGSAERVSSITTSVRQAVIDRGIPVADSLRVSDGRFYSTDCPHPHCCPPEGRDFRPDRSLIAAEAIFAGHVALPSRETLADTIAAIEDHNGTLAQATDQAEAHMITRLEQEDGIHALLTESTQAIATAIDKQRHGHCLSNDEVAWLSMVTLLTDVRDAACQLIEDQPKDPHVPVWMEVVRRARPGTVAPAATLLSYAAYLSGQGSLASLALERARNDDPAYPMARQLHQAIVRGLPPKRLLRQRIYSSH